MTRTFRTLQSMRKMRIEYIDDAIDDIIRIRAHVVNAIEAAGTAVVEMEDGR